MIDGRNSAKTADSRLRVHPSKSPNAHCGVSDARLPQFPGPDTVRVEKVSSPAMHIFASYSISPLTLLYELRSAWRENHDAV
jgi:hypothetical protein